MAFDPTINPPTTVQFVENIKRIKQLTLTWARAKNTREDIELRHLEAQLDHISKLEDGGYYSHETKENLRSLETQCKNLLDDKEVE